MKTIFIDDDLHKLLKLKSISEGRPLTKTIDTLLRNQLEKEMTPGKIPSYWLRLQGVFKGDKTWDEAQAILKESWKKWKTSA